MHRLAEGDSEKTIVFCHPGPGAGNLDPVPEETARRKVTLLSVDRPGYGESEMVQGDIWATIGSAADDIAEILRKIHVESASVVGWSAGGRIALALAARHPDLVDRVVVLATPAPDEAVPWIPAEQKQGVEALRGLCPAEAYAQLGEHLLPDHPTNEDYLSLMGRSPADDAALAMPGATERITHMMQAAFAQGTAGLAADIVSYCLCPWGFTPAEVQAKTLCLYGAKDPIAGSRHGNWWQKNLPDARLEMVPDAGHLLILLMWKRVLSHLAPGTG